jgi:CoA:oxalate CoA-transferase
VAIFSAFEGIRVLDLTVNLAGPFATQILGSLGADVIKVERPGRGDDSRHYWPAYANGESVVFATVNGSKRSTVYDLKDPEAVAEVIRLGATCDVVVESFRPGKADKMGIGYADFKAANESIIYCSISAYGNGPVGRPFPGYDPLIQAFVGIMAMTGHPGNPPTRVAASLIDRSTGMWAALGILAALADRERTGDGQYIEATLVDAGFMIMGHQIASYLATGEIPGKFGSSSPINAPYEAFQTGDGWVMIAAGNDSLFDKLCQVLEVPELLTDERFGTLRDRVENRDELHELLERPLLADTTATWLEKVHAAGVPIGPVNAVDQAVAHPIVEERGLLVGPVGNDDPAMQVVRLPLTANGENPPPLRAAPALGEHTEEVLAEVKAAEDALAGSADRA